MPDNKRVDLGADLDKIAGDLLADVKAATEHVKRREASDRAKEARDAAKGKSRKTSAMIIAIAAVVLVLLAYIIVFARSGTESENTLGNGRQPAQNSATSGPIARPGARMVIPKAPPRFAHPAGQGTQPMQRPPDDYEQPQGM